MGNGIYDRIIFALISDLLAAGGKLSTDLVADFMKIGVR